MKTWRSASVVAMVLTVSVVGYLPFSSAQDGKSVEQMIAEAKAPADHEAIAAYYEKEAQEMHQKHTQHKQMGDAYAKIQVLRSKTGAISHCNDIAKYDDKIAKEYEALAKLHHDLAKTAK
jgi:hypothetical protein